MKLIPSFDRAWTLEMEQEWQDSNINEGGTPEERSKRRIAIRYKLQMAIGDHILYLGKLGLLENPPHSEHVKSKWLTIWRKIVAGEDISEKEKDFVTKGIPMGINIRKFGDAIEVQRDKVVSHIIRGNIDWLGSDFIKCKNSGAILIPQCNQWKLYFEEYIKENANTIEPLKEGRVVAPIAHHLEINLPTGKLLVADWLRNNAMDEATRGAFEDTGLDSAVGFVRRTLNLAKLGVVHVASENTTTIFSETKHGLIARGFEEDNDEYDENGEIKNAVGSISNNISATTMIDRSTLSDILAQNMTREEAENEINILIDNENILEIDIVPGTYHLYFAGDHEHFKEKFEEKFQTEGLTRNLKAPYFALLNKPLDLKNITEAAPETSEKLVFRRSTKP